MAIRDYMGLDTTAIKARFPELVQQFMKTVTSKRFTIT
mgnify:CR=1 FL=1